MLNKQYTDDLWRWASHENNTQITATWEHCIDQASRKRHLVHNRNFNLMKLNICHGHLPYFETQGSGGIPLPIRFIWKYPKYLQAIEF